jgi:hypothetical protein
MNTIKTLALATIIIRQHPKISNVMNAWITTKKRLRLSSMSHFQDKAMPAY